MQDLKNLELNQEMFRNRVDIAVVVVGRLQTSVAQ